MLPLAHPMVIRQLLDFFLHAEGFGGKGIIQRSALALASELRS